MKSNQQQAQDLVDIFDRELIEAIPSKAQRNHYAKRCAITCVRQIAESWRQDDGAHFYATAKEFESLIPIINRL